MAKRVLVILLILAVITRFGGLFWGQGFFFHPDENNMGQAVVSLRKTGDPHFYAYGEFPLLVVNFFCRLLPGRPAFPSAIYGLRLLSALAGVLLVLVGFFWSRWRHWQPVWLFPLLLIFSPGLIQAAHFGTTETLLALELFLTVYFLGLFAEGNGAAGWGLSFVLGLAVATKISSLSFALLAVAVVFYLAWKQRKKGIALISPLITLITIIGFSPIYWQNSQKVWQVINYEGKVARGIIPVFYTQQFAGTWPIIFHLQKVFPWILGLPLYLLFFPAIFYLVRENFHRWRDQLLYLPVLGWVANLFLFVKWIRFALPLVVFMVMVVAWFWQRYYHRRMIFVLGLVFLILPGLIFNSLYFRPDDRWRASQWLNRLPPGTTLLEEAGNVYSLPLTNRDNLRILVVDFYHLDTSPEEQQKLAHYLTQADKIVLASRRVFANYLPRADQFPKTAAFYRQLFSGRLGFGEEKVITPWPKWLNIFLGSDLASEETWTVFDHPTIRIWMRIKKG